MVVAKFTEFFGADQSNQLYMYGTARPKPVPMMKLPTANIPKFTAKVTVKNPMVEIKKPIGKILSCNFLKKRPNEAPTGILTKLKIPDKTDN